MPSIKVPVIFTQNRPERDNHPFILGAKTKNILPPFFLKSFFSHFPVLFLTNKDWKRYLWLFYKREESFIYIYILCISIPRFKILAWLFVVRLGIGEWEYLICIILRLKATIYTLHVVHFIHLVGLVFLIESKYRESKFFRFPANFSLL